MSKNEFLSQLQNIEFYVGYHKMNDENLKMLLNLLKEYYKHTNENEKELIKQSFDFLQKNCILLDN